MSGNDSGVTSGDQLTLNQNNLSDAVTKNEANVSSTFDASNSETQQPDFSAYPKEINKSKQGKHIPGHNNFHSGKSELTISMNEAANLIEHHSGKGTPVNDNKERVNFGKTIGIYKDPFTGERMPTTIGIIHYSKSGTHIVPARPKED